MSTNPTNTNGSGTPNSSTGATPAPQQTQTQTHTPAQLTPQQKQVMELSAKFKALVNEAKTIGENTQKGKELLMQATKIKAIYDNYIRQRQQAAQAYQARMSGNTTTNTSASTPSSSGNNSNSTKSTPNFSSTNSSQGSQLANVLKQVLTPEQSQQYDKLMANYKMRANNIKDKRQFLKQNIDRLTTEINKQTDVNAKNQLGGKRNELITNLKTLSEELNNLYQQLQNGKRTFYIECARVNPELQRILQKTSQRLQQQKQTGQSKTGTPNSTAPPSGNSSTVSDTNLNSATQQIVGNNAPAQVPTSQQPSQTPQPQQATSNAPANKKSTQTANNKSQDTQPTQIRPQDSQSQSVATNAAVATNPSSNKSTIFKPSDPSIPISENISVDAPDAVSIRSNRPTITGGSGMNAAVLNTPAIAKLPPYEIDTERVMSKRKLRELVKVVGIDEGDGETVIDGDVEELLLDLADDFITNVTSFACRLAKHRKSDNLDAKDIQLHLEKNWNIRIPGYSADKIRSTRKWNPSASYNQKLQSINGDKNGTSKQTGSSNKK
ncbi:similar to Saccharomyces cerevisiae YDR145W TAF12 Subunit (61/68 kDa) of TFIID and SAGA complexes [Maudiozyma barnettii]|uniref:TBP-associated factor 12 n=1 Tax=Maudiozyma barnettii TaxID=61262 RepID=A0A8H2ZHE8_9SACH|nr:Taf12p [Kazachstania barnettii]CAB4255684.1 similar to Saccharomyces cerevisiae YDR145W TAF12 Subunit (61/68 kDa) of TFIID and SAGA complexes [Kazachstania barnettii]CAD1784245.1 similar to Saccharomyces cerevisiae YDR145W TAF12 Subunit (61/68 kDa) of TFIID and SAGA complexes [Kazachstania barnettii]